MKYIVQTMRYVFWKFRPTGYSLVTFVFVALILMRLVDYQPGLHEHHTRDESPVPIRILESNNQNVPNHVPPEQDSASNEVDIRDIKLDGNSNPIAFPLDPSVNNVQFGGEKPAVPVDSQPYGGYPPAPADSQAYGGYPPAPADSQAYGGYAAEQPQTAQQVQNVPQQLPVMRKQSPGGEKLITILMWNPFFQNDDYYFGIGQQPFIDNQCRVQTCQTTRDHAFLDTAEAVVVHGPRVDEPMPPYRPTGQLYAYVQAEPHYNGSKTHLPSLANTFNITMTNRRDSDIYIAYGMVMPSPTAARTRGDVFISPFTRPNAVVWPVSHCNTPGRRERYVLELRNHIQVDIYGACGKLVCPKSDECMEKFTKEYKFYLALENHYCKDYVSEKLYRTLEFDIIPIVFGGADYSKDAPPHSVINILDYPNPKDLADYLNYLSANDTAFNEYFEWKKHYVIEHFRHVIYGGVFCRLCEILHDPSYQYRDYRDLYSWWIDDMCDPNVVGRMARKYNWFHEKLIW